MIRKKLKFLFLGFLVACVGTDEVEDKLTSLEIVTPDDVTSVNGSFAKLLGQEAQLSVIATTDLGGSFPFDAVTWESSNPNVATIDGAGLVATTAAGNTFITATAFDVTSEPVMVAVTQDLTSVAIVEITTAGNLMVIEAGESIQLSATPLNVQGEPIENVEIQWTSDRPEVATIDENGLATGISNGTVRISALAEGGTGFIDLMVGTEQSLSRTGTFSGLNGYRTSGGVTLGASADGSLTVNLANDFSAQNGPGLYLYLSNSSNTVAGGLELGALRSTSGEDTYEVPSTVGLEDFNHVIVYCKPFGVGFGTAELSN